VAKKKTTAKNGKKTESKWEQIGLVTIQTGSLLLIDPCYAAAYDATKLRRNEQIVIEANQTAVVTSTGWGDGRYLVEGRYYKVPGQHDDFRLAEIRVKFIDDDGESVCEPKGTKTSPA
jgi:hypothetical protein